MACVSGSRTGVDKAWEQKRYSLSWLFQRLLDILYPMVARVSVKIERPFRLAFSAAEPFFRCILKSSQYILLNLPMPS
jgi:hypothetical protein